MSVHRVVLLVEVNDEDLAEFVRDTDGGKPPYTDNVPGWDGSDIFAAADEGLIDPRETELESVELLADGWPE